MRVLGLDIGGTGIKGAVVDCLTGTLVSERIKLATPQPATVQNIKATLEQLVKLFEWENKPMGIGFPCVIDKGICLTANNIDDSCIGEDLFAAFGGDNKDLSLTVTNDADVAALAESEFGAGKNVDGLVILITLGTGIGTGFMFNGQLIPNVELGSIPWRESIAERYCANKIRKEQDLSWKEWGIELNLFLNYVERIYYPSMIILGGGVSKKFAKYQEYIQLERNTRLVTAQFLNDAGIIGSALASYKKYQAV